MTRTEVTGAPLPALRGSRRSTFFISSIRPLHPAHAG
jgi:hypothetical protein